MNNTEEIVRHLEEREIQWREKCKKETEKWIIFEKERREFWKKQRQLWWIITIESIFVQTVLVLYIIFYK